MASSSTSECALCNDPLLIPTSSNTAVIDDVQLLCSHHFHWTCIMDYATSSPTAKSHCPSCHSTTLNPSGDFLVTIRNEGGTIPNFDLGEEIEREAFLEENPRARRIEVFLSLMAQMEFEEAELFLRGEDGGGEGREPLSPNVVNEGESTTALHICSLNDDVEGVRLLLRYGADKGVVTEDGLTALDLARSQGAERVVALLSS